MGKASYESLSFSKLSVFEQCPRRFHHQYILKDAKDKGSEQLRYGLEVHKQLEDYVNFGKPLPEHLAHLMPLIDSLLAKFPSYHAELEMAVDDEWNPCPWFAKKRSDPEPRWRAKADLVLYDHKDPEQANFALLIDWKTGKVKEELDQLELSAAMLRAHYPNIQKVRPLLVFTEHKQMRPTEEVIIPAESTDQIVDEFEDRGENVEHAKSSGRWQPRKSGLCRYCPCTPQQCEHKR